MFAPVSNRGPPGVTSGLVMYVMLPTGYLGTMAATNKSLAQINTSLLLSKKYTLDEETL